MGGGVHAMHDPTEGGIATAVRELATAAEVGAEVWIDRLIVPDETGALCGFFDLDPLGVISSGALLIATEPSRSQPILEKTEKREKEKKTDKKENTKKKREESKKRKKTKQGQ